MPNLDKTGPGGKGPNTGRGLGRCTPDISQKMPYTTEDCGRGRGLPPCGGMGQLTKAFRRWNKEN